MACPDSSWKTVPVEHISSILLAAKHGENGGNQLKDKNQEPNFMSDTGKKHQKTKYYD